MSRPKVSTFFYGSYMNPDVLGEVGIVPQRSDVASLDDYALEIRPLANLVARPGAAAHGIVVPVTHAELERLYAHARDVLGGVYLPHPVLVQTGTGSAPALCYLAPALAAAPAERDYVLRVLEPARRHGFPAEYLALIESFLP